MSVVRLAQAQINVTVGAFNENRHTIRAWIERAKDAGADLVTFPELAVCGYPPEDLLTFQRFRRDNRRFLELLVGDCADITVVVGFAEEMHGRVYNAAAVIHDRELIGVYHKMELPNYAVFDEKRYFSEGTEGLVIEIRGVRFSVTVCEDVWVPGSPAEAVAVNGKAHALLNVSASPFHRGKLFEREGIHRRFVDATGMNVFFTNLVGGQDELIFDGGSLFMTSSGEVVSRARRFEPDLLITDFDPAVYPPMRKPTASPDVPVQVVQPRVPDSRPEPAIPNRIEPAQEGILEIHNALILGIRDYVAKNGFQKAVLGLSGGIDSALTAVLAVTALGKDNVTAVTMPSHVTSTETLTDAGRLAENLHIELLTIPVREIFDVYMNQLADHLPSDRGVAAENLQARIRGNILMALSNRFGWLVLTTGNKSEIAVGYCTLYGDTAGGFAVIKDVPKTVVYELSRYVNDREAREIIPASIIKRAPSAELKPDQKDEDSLPPYDILDPILKAYVEDQLSPEEITAQGFEATTVEYVLGLVDKNEYKRRQAPPGIRITPRAFGKDRRLPITNRYGVTIDTD